VDDFKFYKNRVTNVVVGDATWRDVRYWNMNTYWSWKWWKINNDDEHHLILKLVI